MRLAKTPIKKPNMAEIHTAAEIYLDRMKYAMTLGDQYQCKRDYYRRAGDNAKADKVWTDMVKRVYTPKERWKAIDHGGSYGVHVSTHGRVKVTQRVATGTLKRYTLIRPYGLARHGQVVTTANSNLFVDINEASYNLAYLVASTFSDRPTPQHVYLQFIDGDWKNVAFTNLKWLTKLEFAVVRHRQQPNEPRKVIYTPTNGDPVVFVSAREAGRALYLNEHTVRRYCNGEVKSPLYQLQWHEMQIVDYVDQAHRLYQVAM